MPHVSLTVTGQKEITLGLQAFGDAAHDMTQPFTAMVDDVLIPMEQQRFANEGPGWKPLSPAYAAWKQLHYGGKQILERSGKMKSAFTSRGDVYTASADRLTISITAATSYAPYHQLGTSRMPARPPFDWTPDSQTQFAQYLEKYLTAKAKAAGLQVNP